MDSKLLHRLARAIADAARDGNRTSTSGPRSRVVEAIAVLLYSRPMRASEIAEILGFTSRYVSSYLSYWKTRGLFEYRDGYWMLTEEGRRYAETVIEKHTQAEEDRIVALARKILATHSPPARNDKIAYHLHRQYQHSLPSLARKTIDERQARELCIRYVMDSVKEGLTPEELEVLEVLLEHYKQWGKTYMYIDQLQEQLEADILWLKRVAKSLQSKDIIYVYHDKRMGIRIGLSKKLRQHLDNCLSGITGLEGS